MYIHRKRSHKKSSNRCARKNARLRIKNRKRKMRMSGLPH